MCPQQSVKEWGLSLHTVWIPSNVLAFYDAIDGNGTALSAFDSTLSDGTGFFPKNFASTESLLTQFYSLWNTTDNQ